MCVVLSWNRNGIYKYFIRLRPLNGFKRDKIGKNHFQLLIDLS
jgi:hypothetical protein